MSDAFVIDASAVLALLNGEPGADAVAVALGASVISAVNWSEVIQKVTERGLSSADLADEMEALGLAIVPFEVAHAQRAAELWAGGARSISLADRACLATASVTGLDVLTADRAWTALDLGVRIEAIR